MKEMDQTHTDLVRSRVEIVSMTMVILVMQALTQFGGPLQPIQAPVQILATGELQPQLI